MKLADMAEIAELTDGIKLDLGLAAKAHAGTLEIGLSYPLDIPEFRAALQAEAYGFFVTRANRRRERLQEIIAAPAAIRATEEGAQAQSRSACAEVPTEGAN